MMLQKIVIAVLVLILILAGGYYFLARKEGPAVVESEPDPETEIDEPIVITKKEIKEENFSGSYPLIIGESPLAKAARTYVEKIISEFETRANTDVPEMREDFGPDSSVASYTIDIEGSLVQSRDTQSVILGIYEYTGGAHGSSSFKVFTAGKNGEILTLKDIIREDKREAFMEYLKKKLIDWRPPGSTEPVVFEEDVMNLKFEDLSNWSLNDKDLTIYFGQYEVGPGVLGAFPFPLSRMEIADFLL